MVGSFNNIGKQEVVEFCENIEESIRIDMSNVRVNTLDSESLGNEESPYKEIIRSSMRNAMRNLKTNRATLNKKASSKKPKINLSSYL